MMMRVRLLRVIVSCLCLFIIVITSPIVIATTDIFANSNQPPPFTSRTESRVLAEYTVLFNITYSIVISPVKPEDYDACIELYAIDIKYKDETCQPYFADSQTDLTGKEEPSEHHSMWMTHHFPYRHTKVTYDATRYGNPVLIGLVENLQAGEIFSKIQQETDSLSDEEIHLLQESARHYGLFDEFEIFNQQNHYRTDQILPLQVQVFVHRYNVKQSVVTVLPIFTMSFQDMVAQTRASFNGILDPITHPEPHTQAHSSDIFPVNVPVNMIPMSFRFRCDSERMLTISSLMNTEALTPDHVQNVCSFTEGTYYTTFSQNGQDLEVIRYFQGRRYGKYLEIGANDGMTHSNTITLDKSFGWSGLLIEPLKRMAPNLWATRGGSNNQILNACVHNRTYFAEFMEVGSTGQLFLHYFRGSFLIFIKIL